MARRRLRRHRCLRWQPRPAARRRLAFSAVIPQLAALGCKDACAEQEERRAARTHPAMQSEELRAALAGHLDAVGSGGAALRSDELRAALAGHLDAAAEGFPVRSEGLRA